MSKIRSKRFKGWDKVKIIDDFGDEKEAIAPVIISPLKLMTMAKKEL